MPPHRRIRAARFPRFPRFPRFRQYSTGLSLLLAAMLLTGCGGGDPGTGPVEVKWDRDGCERCRMVLSERHYAAQVRDPQKRVHLFDDLGCALIWLEDQPFKADPKTEIWVTDAADGHWIDAREAAYAREHKTPMDYGLGASENGGPDSLDFDQAREHIFTVERRFHGGGH